MPTDSDRITISKCPDDLSSMLFDALSEINYKVAFFIMFFYIILSSDVFINKVLSTFNGAVIGKETTSWGATIAALILGLLYITVDAVVKQKII
jgi:hypothetical protein